MGKIGGGREFRKKRRGRERAEENWKREGVRREEIWIERQEIILDSLDSGSWGVRVRR